MAELVFFRRGEELMRVALDRARTVIGRGAQSDVTIPHPEVSRAQAAVVRTPDGFELHDLSGRGTSAGGTLTERCPLADGLEIAFGDYRAVFRSTPSADTSRTGTGREATDAIASHSQIPAEAVLVVRERGVERVVALGTEATIGKDPGCTVVLADGFASSVHCRLFRVAGGVLLHDLASTNGTHVNGVRVGQAELALGTVVRAGETELWLQLPPSAGPIPAFEGLVSADRSMLEAFELVQRVAPSSAPVAILGETGTGKELIAAAIHGRSERAKAPFVPLNCASISAELVESELFGHEKGAFTGAATQRRGAFEEADGGTLFLDEVGELTPDVQAKLLRALELGEIKRVGSSKPFRVDARVICATNKDLRAGVKKGTFREDLYYRLCVIRVELPPLRRRPGDVTLLCDHFLERQAPSGTRPSLDPAAREKLTRHRWPGNVRELRNVLTRALLLRRGAVIAAGDVVFDSGEPPPEPTSGAAEGDNSITLHGKTLVEIEAEATLKAFRRHAGVRRKVARELGISRSTAQKRAQELGIAAQTSDEEDDAP